MELESIEENDINGICKEFKTNLNISRLVDVDEIFSMIKEKDLRKTKVKNSKDINSLSYLIPITLSQSHSIKLGILLEKNILYQIIKFTNLRNIKEKNMKGIRERNHLFKDDNKKIVYYAELKGNLNLDTEKSKSTIDKCIIIKNELEIKYPLYEIKWGLVSLRFLTSNEIPRKIIKKYDKIKNNLYGLNDYLSLLQSKLFTSKTQIEFYTKLANYIQSEF